jgi:hypothetical protein
MKKWIAQARRKSCAELWIAVAAATLCCAPAWQAQSQEGFPQEHSRHSKQVRALPQRLPPKPSQPAAFSIPVTPLGFTAPGAIYLGQRNSLASLDFLDENRLLFTFRVPGLLHRGAESAEQDELRQIRAVVLALPAGIIQSEALWTLHDRTRYLWMLRDGHFLLRDREIIQQGDATLELKPLLRFPGPLTWMELDPSQQFLVTDSHEPATVEAKPGDVPSPETASAEMIENAQTSDRQKEIVVRILRRESGQVMLLSRTRTSVHVPINSDGYLECLRGEGIQWTLTLNDFTGGSRVLGRVDSACMPTLGFVSQKEVLATTCDPSGGRRMVAMNVEGHRLWQDANASVPIWPLLVRSPDGSRLARESLAVTHPVSASAPLDSDDIKGQLVEVFDAATGQVALTATASPVLDAGGNVAISPSGRRVAVISDGAIQVFELPAPPPVP